MTPTEIKAAADVMLAYAKMVEEKGEAYAHSRLQALDLTCPYVEWVDLPIAPIWNLDKTKYRIKPEPREWWIVITKKGGYHDVHDAYPVQQALCANQSQVHVREVLE